MAKVVYNACYGGFGLSAAAKARYVELKSVEKFPDEYTLLRHDHVLVQVVEEMDKAANGMYADLQIEVLPDGTQYRIDEYDGNESVETKDSYIWQIAE